LSAGWTAKITEAKPEWLARYNYLDKMSRMKSEMCYLMTQKQLNIIPLTGLNSYQVMETKGTVPVVSCCIKGERSEGVSLYP